MVSYSPQPMIDWINRREAYVFYASRRLIEECAAIDPTLLERVASSDWRGLGETPEARLADFLAKGDIALAELGIYIHPGGEPFATIAAVIAEMDKRAPPRSKAQSAS